MQTFLPYPDFARSAACLDRQRLGKQRVECLQILNTLSGASQGWANHPAVHMWRGHGDALWDYGMACIREWRWRGYTNNMVLPFPSDDGGLPPWLGDPAFHASHRAALLHKAPEHYGQFGWAEQPALAYVWPV